MVLCGIFIPKSLSGRFFVVYVKYRSVPIFASSV